MAATSVPGSTTPAAQRGGANHRWFVLGVVGLAQLMIVLDISVMNIALPSAQRALQFSNADRQWVITAYALTFGSLLLFGGRISDLFGRKRAFLIGLVGFAVASAVGGASVNFTMLITARACQGAFGALLAPTALSVLTTTFSDPKERGRAFGVYGAIAGGGGLIGLLLGGVLTEYLDWRWCLYVNLLFAAAAAVGAILMLPRARQTGAIRLDLMGVVAVSASMFCLVYGLSNAASHNWRVPSTWGFLIAGAVLLVAFAARQMRAAHPLLPPRIVLDRNRGGANLAILVVGAAMFGLFLFLTYYLQTVLGYSPVITGVAFLPAIVMVMTFAQISNIVLMPRIGPKPLVGLGLLIAAAGMAWLSGIGVHTSYAVAVLGPLMVSGAGIGMSMPPSMNTGTFGVSPREAGVASATLNVGQQLGGSIGTALLNTIATSAAATYVASHLSAAAAAPTGRSALQAAAAVHGYSTAFLTTAGIFAGGAIVCGTLLRRGPLTAQAGSLATPAGTPAAQDATAPAERMPTVRDAAPQDAPAEP
ncbi:MAG TPA: MFS transporter [Streptosporangiaceae bacterium]|jgi:EmrB/QacA subfamily drug resistance transporter